jgi:HlyD family secretion protein
VSFTVDAYPSRTFIGRVVQIRNAPVTVQNVVTYDTVIGVTNADFKLKPGMTATVSITTAQRSNVFRIPNSALRFKPAEPSTNQTLVARMLAKVGLGQEAKTAATNAVEVAKAAGTNKVEATGSGSPPLTGNEPPEELARRVREMRDRGEQPPPAIQAKVRELYQSGVLQRPGGGGGGMGGGGGSRPRPGPVWRNIYILTTTTPPGGGEPVSKPEPVRVRLGITDNSYTEVLDGLKEGDLVITGVKLPAAQAAAAAPAGQSPFGGPPRMR